MKVRMKPAFLTIVLSLCAGELHGAFERLPEGGRAAAMGGVAAAVLRDPFALRINPSLAAILHDRSVSLSFSPSWLGIPELRKYSCLYIEPAGIGTFSGSVERFGFELYSETDISAGFGSGTSTRFHYGLAVHLYHLGIAGYGAATAGAFDAGFSYSVSDDLLLGCSAANITGSRIGACRERIPQSLTFGAGYRPAAGLEIAADLERDPAYPLEFRLGAACEIFQCLSLRAGTTDRPSTYSAGMGLAADFIDIDYALTSHPELGVTHHFSITVFPGKM